MSSPYEAPQLPGCALWGEQLTRPTTSFARGCKLWSRERQFYENERHQNMMQFGARPYLSRQYPEIGKHYPGTWRVVNPSQLDEIVMRLTQPTRASISRADDIRERTAYVRYVVDTEKAKDIMYPGPRGGRPAPHSADPRLEGNNTTRRGETKSVRSSRSTTTTTTGSRGKPQWEDRDRGRDAAGDVNSGRKCRDVRDNPRRWKVTAWPAHAQCDSSNTSGAALPAL